MGLKRYTNPANTSKQVRWVIESRAPVFGVGVGAEAHATRESHGNTATSRIRSRPGRDRWRAAMSE